MGVILHTGLEEDVGPLKRHWALPTGSAEMLGVVFTVRAVDSSGAVSWLSSEPGNPGLLALGLAVSTQMVGRELCSGEEHWCTRVIQINSLDLFTKTLAVMFMGEVSRVKN